MATSLVSALTGIPIDKNLAMTGEITLRGNVLPIGGLKEKALAAHRGGITRICLPKENENDIEDIPATVRDQLEFIPVAHVDEVLYEALVTDGRAGFERLLDQTAIRDEVLFSDFVKEEDKVSAGRDGSKSAQISDVVTH